MSTARIAENRSISGHIKFTTLIQIGDRCEYKSVTDWLSTDNMLLTLERAKKLMIAVRPTSRPIAPYISLQVQFRYISEGVEDQKVNHHSGYTKNKNGPSRNKKTPPPTL